MLLRPYKLNRVGRSITVVIPSKVIDVNAKEKNISSEEFIQSYNALPDLNKDGSVTYKFIKVI